MILFILLAAMLAFFIYGFTSTLRNDTKKIMLHRLSINHSRMEALYARLEELIFIKDYASYATRDNTMSYDLYLTGMKKQNNLFEKEMHELRTSKFNNETQQYYSEVLNFHDRELKALLLELHRVEHTYLLHPHHNKQLSA